MSTIDPNYLSPYLNVTSGAYTAATATPTATEDGAASSSQSSTQSSAESAATITLSDEAKAFLASAGNTTAATALASVAADARAWLDEQNKKLALAAAAKPKPDAASGAATDEKPKIDLSSRDRATLTAIASNAQKLFSGDEQAAAGTELQKRFGDALTPYVVIARKTGNYAPLYQAASDYLDKAGPDERATKAWQNDKKAVVDGLAAAKASKGKAPDNIANDPVRGLLDKRTASAVSASDGASTIAANARAMLDDQANHATDDGTILVFDATEAGQVADFTKFNNRSLATVALNTDDTFSGEEARAAKAELNQRTRLTMMGIFNPSSGSSSGADMNLGLIKTYDDMSDEEKSVLGVTDAVTDRLIQNLQTLQSLQNAFASGGAAGGAGGTASGSASLYSLSAALMANRNGGASDDNAEALNLASLL